MDFDLRKRREDESGVINHPRQEEAKETEVPAFVMVVRVWET